jgi:hypothetical protein
MMFESSVPFGFRQHNALGFGFAASQAPSSPQAGPSKSPSRRRKRSLSPEASHADQMEGQQQQEEGTSMAAKRIKSESFKRFKSPLNSNRPRSPSEDVDLGKMLSACELGLPGLT